MITEPVKTDAVKPGLLALLKVVGEEWIAVLDAAGEAERTQAGTFERWSFKDTVAHVAYWQQWEVDQLGRIRRGETLLSTKDADDAAVYAQYQHMTWDAIRAMAETAQQGLCAAIGTVSEALLDMEVPGRMNGDRHWTIVLGHGVWHPCDHMTSFYRSRGQISHALHLHQRVYDTARSMPSPGKMRGGAVYNIACVYALSGEPVKALNAFREALQHDPWLLHWSKEDGDMRFLRMLPGYDALIKQFNLTRREEVKSSHD
jgi:uncharacterized damage-inducible protein DinB